MITLAVENSRQGKVDQLGMECVVVVTLAVYSVLKKIRLPHSNRTHPQGTAQLMNKIMLYRPV